MRAIIIVAIALLWAGSAEARRRPPAAHNGLVITTNDGKYRAAPESPRQRPARARSRARPTRTASRGQHRARRALGGSYGVVDIGGRPAGCPHAYCGCGLRKYLGIADPDLNLARAWGRKYPRVAARSGAVAVRSHHVFLLEEQVDGILWRVRDFNSGGGRSRVHVRSVRGYSFVDPSSRHVAVEERRRSRR